MRPTIFCFLFFFIAAVFVNQASAQPTKKTNTAKTDLIMIRSSPAFAEVIIRGTELESELESLLIEYTDDFPRVKELRFALSLINKESAAMLAVKPEEASKLTLALGKLIVKKVEAAADLWRLQQSYADGHPEVKRAKRKLEIYEKAIKEILG